MSVAPDLEFELANTRRMLERLPQEHWKWQPHTSSMSMIHLATHIVRIARIGESTVHEPSFDLLSGEHIPDPSDSADLLRMWDEHVASLKAALNAAADGTWRETWKLTRGEMVLREMPRDVALRIVALNHMMHHRAQLSVYLRMVGVPVPGMYGPSADEQQRH